MNSKPIAHVLLPKKKIEMKKEKNQMKRGYWDFERRQDNFTFSLSSLMYMLNNDAGWWDK